MTIQSFGEPWKSDYKSEDFKVVIPTHPKTTDPLPTLEAARAEIASLRAAVEAKEAECRELKATLLRAWGEEHQAAVRKAREEALETASVLLIKRSPCGCSQGWLASNYGHHMHDCQRPKADADAAAIRALAKPEGEKTT